jgi:hypothetical protein
MHISHYSMREGGILVIHFMTSMGVIFSMNDIDYPTFFGAKRPAWGWDICSFKKSFFVNELSDLVQLTSY